MASEGLQNGHNLSHSTIIGRYCRYLVTELFFIKKKTNLKAIFYQKKKNINGIQPFWLVIFTDILRLKLFP